LPSPTTSNKREYPHHSQLSIKASNNLAAETLKLEAMQHFERVAEDGKGKIFE